MSVSPLNSNVTDEIVDTQSLLRAIHDDLDVMSDRLPQTAMALTHVRAVKNALTGLHAVVRSFPTDSKEAA